jgi:hypothetical protein
MDIPLQSLAQKKKETTEVKTVASDQQRGSGSGRAARQARSPVKPFMGLGSKKRRTCALGLSEDGTMDALI